MTTARAILSPRTTNGSFIWSIFAHVAILGSVYFILSLSPKVDTSQDYIDLGYETLEEPPAPAQEEKKITHSPDPVAKVDPKAIPDNTPKELQDNTGTISGSQVAKAEQNLGSDSNGSATATPYYKIKPKYPKAALISGTEGWILMNIDINEQGEVENVRVVDGVQRDMFQTEARRAVSQWKYKPFVDASGNPVRKADHQVRVDFKLQDADSGS